MKNTRVTSNTKLCAIVIILAIIIAMLCISFSGIIKAQAEVAENPIGFEQKIFSTVDLDDDFDDNCIIVVMDKFSSGFNKNHSRLFSKLPFKKVIEDLTSITGSIIDRLYLNKESFRQILKIELEEPSKQNVLSAINEIQKLDGVLCVGVNRHYYPTVSSETPTAMSGTRYQKQWALNGDYGINAEEAWNYSTGSKNIKVGIIDSGIADHDDLRDNVIEGWNFVDNNNDTSDQFGHGTNIAGIIGATGATENGVIGINWNVKMVPLKVISTSYVYDDDEKLPTYDGSAIIDAINWSINNNVDILNMSFGDYYDDDTEPFKYAMNNYNGLMVCGAGNDGNDNDTNNFYPANYSKGEEFSDRVISVGAINSSGNLATFNSISSTNYGATTVSLFAPGMDLLTTCVPNVDSYLNHHSGYVDNAAGSSNATPHVVGVAALLFTRYYRYIDKLNGGQVAAHIKATILKNVTPTDKCYDLCVSHGILNAASAMKYCTHIPSIMSGYGYDDGWYYWKGRVDLEGEKPKTIVQPDDGELIIYSPTNLNFTMTTTSAFNAVTDITIYMTFVLTNSSGEVVKIGNLDSFNHTVYVGLVSNSQYGVCDFTVNESELVNKERYTLTWTCESSRRNKTYTNTMTFSFTVNYDYVKEQLENCIADNSLITLADGSQIAVEDLTGNEELLVWNMYTGTFDTAPILFIDKDEQRAYEVINLYFSDGTSVKVIGEHGFWDFDLNKYVFLRKDADKYIGHWFNKQTIDEDGNLAYTKVQLTDVKVQTEVTSAWSPVTYGHLCYYVNGMLTMPGATTGLINIFDVDPQTMKIDEESYLADIENYGLFTYEEFAEICSFPETIFEAFCGQYLKIAIGKGLITIEELQNLISRYSKFWE